MRVVGSIIALLAALVLVGAISNAMGQDSAPPEGQNLASSSPAARGLRSDVPTTTPTTVAETPILPSKAPSPVPTPSSPDVVAEASTRPTSAPPAPVTPAATAPAAPATPSPAASRPSTALLYAASGGDGDSWKDTRGVEYRLGLVNTPELGECFGAEANAERKRLVAGGFRAQVYTRDSFGRSVAVVTLPNGTNLNVYLARAGFADDRFLEEFRSENRALAADLDRAFAAAKRERVGLWSACAAPAPAATEAAPPAPRPATTTRPPVTQPPATQPATSSCHPAYATCIPIKGTGSGSGDANDLDCGDIRKLVLLNQIGNDPYRLDGSDKDGRGCESYA